MGYDNYVELHQRLILALRGRSVKEICAIVASESGVSRNGRGTERPHSFEVLSESSDYVVAGLVATLPVFAGQRAFIVAQALAQAVGGDIVFYPLGSNSGSERDYAYCLGRVTVNV